MRKETVEEFQARGGKIEYLEGTVCFKTKHSPTVLSVAPETRSMVSRAMGHSAILDWAAREGITL